MRLIGSDPDVETIFSRIKNGDIDLQPDFQRGEVWGRPKKQRLIDSILRGWHVPPIHLIELQDSGRQEVLDGQQRLASIRDFCTDQFPIDGTLDPTEPALQGLDGVLFSQLPPQWRRRFMSFTIRMLRVVDYLPGEPGEIFLRLNQPTKLTGAEQRNAFYGPVRKQIKSVVNSMEGYGITKEYLGFSNARMSYDDVVARVALSLERRSIAVKITSDDLIALYRCDEPLSTATLNILKPALKLLGETRAYAQGGLRFNKATAYSWLMFLVRHLLSEEKAIDAQRLAQFIDYFQDLKEFSWASDETPVFGGALELLWLVSAHEKRASARVADISSVLLRDVAIWGAYDAFHRQKCDSPLPKVLNHFYTLVKAYANKNKDDEGLARFLLEAKWGEI